jgi:hypothetical protein
VSLLNGVSRYIAELTVRGDDGAAGCVAEAPKRRKVKLFDELDAGAEQHLGRKADIPPTPSMSASDPERTLNGHGFLYPGKRGVVLTNGAAKGTFQSQVPSNERPEDL